MIKFLVRRVLAGISVLLFTIFLTFLIMRALPGGPFDFSGSREMPVAVKNALEARFGMDKPFLLNLPYDGVTPDLDQTMVVPVPDLPICDKLREGMSVAESKPTEKFDTFHGWNLLTLIQERRTKQIEIKGNKLRCQEITTTLYSDLTRSQFFQYLNNVLRFDLGPSLAQNTRNLSVNDLIADRFPVSAQVGLMSVTIGFLMGIPLGVLAAIYRNTFIDYAVTICGILFASIPTLVLGPLAIVFLVNELKLLPSPDPRAWNNFDLLNWEYLGRALLPVGIIGISMSAGIARLTRASLLQVLRDDYIRTARSKGLRERGVLYIHALKNSLIPVATILGPLLAGILTGTLIIERIFSIPGLGSTFIESIAARDYNLLCGVTILYSTFLILGNIMVDIMYTWLDPRIRFD